jgi:hypothetical protein
MGSSGRKLHHHRLRADRERPRERVVAVHRLLQVHEPLAGRVVGGAQVVLVLDAGDTDPRPAVVGLHEQRVAHAFGDGLEVERLVVARRGVGELGVLGRVLERHEHGVGHLEAQAHHRAVGGVLLHGLERERAVEQVHVVHQRDLLQPLARDVVPVGEPVDDEVVAGRVAQVERLDGDPLDVEGVLLPRAGAHRSHAAHDRLEGGGPVLLGAEQQPDQVSVQRPLPFVRSSGAGGA